MDKLIAEAIGTFFFVFTIGMTVIDPGAGPLAPVAIGFVLAAMIFAMGHISKAHFNPAITVGALAAGKHAKAEVGPYIGAQLLGALAAGLAVIFFKGDLPAAPGPELGAALLAEALFAFALVWVVLNVAAAQGTAGNHFYGLAIGVTVMAGAFAVGPVSGGAFNPAVTLGLCLTGLLPWGMFVAYAAAQCLAGAAAGLLFRALVPASD